MVKVLLVCKAVKLCMEDQPRQQAVPGALCCPDMYQELR